MNRRDFNLSDVQCLHKAHSNLRIGTLALQDREHVDFHASRIRADRIFGHATEYPQYAFVDAPHWTIRTPGIEEFSEHPSWVTLDSVSTVAYTGDFFDMNQTPPISTYLPHPVLTKTFDNVPDTNQALLHLEISDMAKLNQLPNTIDHLALSNFHWGRETTHPDDAFGVYASGNLSFATFPHASDEVHGTVRFGDQDSPYIAYEALQQITEIDDKLKARLGILDDHILLYKQLIQEHAHNYLKADAALTDLESLEDAIQNLRLGTLRSNNLDTLELTDNTTLRVRENLNIPTLAIRRVGGRRENDDGQQYVPLVIDMYGNLSNLPVDYFKPAESIGLDDLKEGRLDGWRLGTIKVYKDQNADADVESGNGVFVPGYPQFLYESTQALDRVNNIPSTVRMTDYGQFGNRIRIYYEDPAIPPIHMYDMYTEKYITSNLLRRDRNLKEINDLLRNAHTGHIIDPLGEDPDLLSKIESELAAHLPSDELHQHLYVVRDELEEVSRRARDSITDYANNSALKSSFLQRIYDELELQPVAIQGIHSPHHMSYPLLDVSELRNDTRFEKYGVTLFKSLSNRDLQQQMRDTLGLGSSVYDDNRSFEGVELATEVIKLRKRLKIFSNSLLQLNMSKHILLKCTSSTVNEWVRTSANIAQEGFVTFTSEDELVEPHNEKAITPTKCQRISDQLREKFIQLNRMFATAKYQGGHPATHFLNREQLRLFEL
jgi:hypothetical protein